jgi:hypothetical protein
MLLLVLSAVITMVVISGVSPTMRLFLRSIWELVRG